MEQQFDRQSRPLADQRDRRPLWNGSATRISIGLERVKRRPPCAIQAPPSAMILSTFGTRGTRPRKRSVMQCGAKPTFDAKRRQSGAERTYLHQMPSVRVVPDVDIGGCRSELPLRALSNQCCSANILALRAESGLSLQPRDNRPVFPRAVIRPTISRPLQMSDRRAERRLKGAD